MRALTETEIHAGRGIRYEALSENSGVLVTEDDLAIVIVHDPKSERVDFMICEKGDKPTLLNKPAAIRMREAWYDAWTGETEAFTLPHPDRKIKPSAQPENKKTSRVAVDEVSFNLTLQKEIDDSLESLIPITGFAANGEAI